MNMFIERLFSCYDEDPSYDLANIADLIHAAPFIVNEDEFKQVQNYIFTIYKELIAANPDESRLISIGLAELILDAGCYKNYKRLEMPDVSVMAREDKAYRLLQMLLIIDPTIATYLEKDEIDLLHTASEYEMDSIVELLLRYDDPTVTKKSQLAYLSIRDGYSPKLLAKFLTKENLESVDIKENEIMHNISNMATYWKLIQFKSKSVRYKMLPDEVVIPTTIIVTRCVLAYAKIVYPFYQELRDYYRWSEEFSKLAYGKDENEQHSRQDNIIPILYERGIKDKILSFCKPRYKEYEILADAACNPLFTAKNSELTYMNMLSVLNQHPGVGKDMMSGLAKSFFEELVRIKRPHPSNKF